MKLILMQPPRRVGWVCFSIGFAEYLAIYGTRTT
jgi:hypothetical protein